MRVILLDFHDFLGVGKSLIWMVWAGNGPLGPENLDYPSKTVLDPTLKSQIGLIKSPGRSPAVTRKVFWVIF